MSPLRYGLVVGIAGMAGVLAVVALLAFQANGDDGSGFESVVSPYGLGAQASASLGDGRILVTGGEIDAFSARPTAGAFLLDAATGAIEPLPEMLWPHSYHTATLLPDGTVLVLGNGTAEIFDPVRRTFAAVDDTPLYRTAHAAVLLGDGTVLVAGGLDEQFQPVAPLERYDPASSTFEVLAVKLDGTLAGGVSLPDGDAMVVGTDALWRFSVGDGALRGPEPLLSAHDPVVLALADGRVLLVGGLEPGIAASEESVPASAALVVVDPATLSQQVVGRLAVPRHRAAAAQLAEGKVLVTGGTPDSHTDGGFLESVELVDPGDWSVIDAGVMHEGRYRHEAIAVGDRVGLIGSPTRDPDKSVEIYES